MKLKLIVILMALVLTSCSTSSISLQSSPAGAEVYASSIGSDQGKLIGKTPVILKPDQIDTFHNGSGPVQLEFRKDGYNTFKTIITDLNASNLTLNLNLNPASGLEDIERLNRIVDMSFEAQRLARVGKYDESLKIISDVKKEAPQLAVSFELEGGVFYLQKKYKEALDSYNMAARFNPKNPETLKMRDILISNLGLSKTPSTTNSTTSETGEVKK